MKSVLMASLLIKAIFTICVAVVAVLFDRASLLWWFLLVPFLGWTYEGKTEKGGEK